MRRWHRLLGAAGAAFFLLLAATGVMINHSPTLDLDGRFVSAPWLLSHYGIDIPPPTEGFRVGSHFVAAINGQLVLGEAVVECDRNELVAALALREYVFIAEPNSLCVYTPAGQLVERVEMVSEVAALTAADGMLIVRTTAGYSIAAPDVMEFQSATIDSALAWAEPEPLPQPVQSSMKRLVAGKVLSAERVILDLHSGRLFGSAGVLLFDLAAIVLTILAVTGLVLWLRTRKTTPSSRT